MSGVDDADLCELSVTANDTEWLAGLAHKLVDDGFVACANIFEVRSIYRWDSATEDHLEARATFHTRTSLFDEISAKVTENHPYDTPAIFAIPIARASDPYRRWVLDQTEHPRRPSAPKAKGAKLDGEGETR